MGSGKKTQQLEAALRQGTGGKEPHYRYPSEGTTASSSGRIGHYRPPPVAYYYQPFSSMDILNWQRHAPPYSGEPKAMIRLMETIYQTHHPTWDDIIQQLVSLFNTEKRHRILTEARKWLREMAPEGTANLQRWAELATPMRGPIETVTQRKGGATWRDIGWLFYKVSRGGLKTYEYGKTL